eukprot:scaffold28065_cov68-Cyclotella_meneghiniana.AAC.5
MTVLLVLGATLREAGREARPPARPPDRAATTILESTKDGCVEYASAAKAASADRTPVRR